MSDEIIKLKKEGDLWVCRIDGQEYGFRKWTWGEKNKTTSQCSRLGPNGETIFDSGEFNIRLLLATLKKAPFKIDRQTIENYPDSVLIDKLLQITTKLNLLGKFEIQNL